jgi:hypothetical protein
VRSSIAAFSIGTSSQLVEPPTGHDEAADVLREVPGKADQLARQGEGSGQARLFGIEPQLAHLVLGGAFAAPAPERAGQRGHGVGREPHGLAGLADRAAAAVADHRGRQPGPVAAVLLVDVLDHLLAALVLEVDVDVGRLVPLGADEALEQQVDPRRVDRGDAETVADRRIGRRTAPLAEDAALAGETHQVLHGQEIGRVAQLADQPELVLERRLDVFGQAPGIAFAPARPGESFE